MKLTLILVRHAERSHVVVESEAGLTRKGKRQAAETAARLRDQGPISEVVLSSGQTAPMQTAKLHFPGRVHDPRACRVTEGLNRQRRTLADSDNYLLYLLAGFLRGRDLRFRSITDAERILGAYSHGIETRRNPQR